MNYNKLIQEALDARKKAYAPYSGFTVGAAVITKDNQIISGCNIENAAFSPSICAERVAIFSAISKGYKNFKAIAIVGDYKDYEIPRDYCSPCGVCRQVIIEFTNKEFNVILARNPEDYKVITIDELLPYCFSSINKQDEVKHEK